MHIKHIALTALFILSPLSCKAINLMSLTLKTTLIAPTTYAAYKFICASGDIKKCKRFIRQDKDRAITYVIDSLRNCKTDFCKQTIQTLKNCTSTPSQILEDKAAETLETVQKAMQQTEAYKATEKKVTDLYSDTKIVIDELAKPKK